MFVLKCLSFGEVIDSILHSRLFGICCQSHIFQADLNAEIAWLAVNYTNNFT